MACAAPEGHQVNKTAWGAKLILTADLVYQVSCARLGHPLMARAQHCHLCLNVCFSPLTAPHPLWTQSALLQPSKKTASKTRGVQIACGISYITRLLSVVGLAWLLKSKY